MAYKQNKRYSNLSTENFTIVYR